MGEESLLAAIIGKTYTNINTGVACVVVDRYFNKFNQKYMVKYECEGETYTCSEKEFFEISKW